MSLCKARDLNFYVTKIVTYQNATGLKASAVLVYTLKCPKVTAKTKSTLNKSK